MTKYTNSELNPSQQLVTDSSSSQRSTALSIRIASIDAMLPQTQCTRCGFPSCLEYAEALATGETMANRCPPGGQAGADRLAAALGKPARALEPACGHEGPRLLAFIEPALCIGCTKCIVACPVDAIIGGPRRMHTVVPALCTGCELCVPPCPVDCIRIEALPANIEWTDRDAGRSRARFEQRQHRMTDDEQRNRERLDDAARQKLNSIDAAIAGRTETGGRSDPVSAGGGLNNAFASESADELQRKRRVVAAAISRARQRQTRTP